MLQTQEIASKVAHIGITMESMQDRKIIATYLTGSRGYKLNNVNSDYDLLVITTDSPKDLLTNQTYSKQFIFTENTVKFDITFYDFRTFYNQINKRSLKAFEILYSKPLYLIDIIPSYSHMMKEIVDNSTSLAQLQLLNLYKATGGLIQKMQTIKKHNRDKDIALPFIYLNMIQQQIDHKFPLSIDMSHNEKIVEIRKKGELGINNSEKLALLKIADVNWKNIKSNVYQEVNNINNFYSNLQNTLENNIANYYNLLTRK